MVTRGGEVISLTATEFELRRFMMRNFKRVLSKAQILDRVWSYDFGPRTLVRHVLFEDGKIVRIDTGSYGYAD